MSANGQYPCRNPGCDTMITNESGDRVVHPDTGEICAFCSIKCAVRTFGLDDTVRGIALAYEHAVHAAAPDVPNTCDLCDGPFDGPDLLMAHYPALGGTVWFCSEECVDAFEGFPDGP